MVDIIVILQGVRQCLDQTSVRRLSCLVPAMLALSGRVTMVGLSRWTGPGGSYRTIQRFFNTAIGWARVNWCLIRQSLLDPADTLLIAGDESVVTKSGHKTYGVDRFFSSLDGKPVPGLAFFSVALMRQRAPRVSRAAGTGAQSGSRAGAPGRGSQASQEARASPGRPNKNRREVELPPALVPIQTMLKKLGALLGRDLKVHYCVLDGAFGHNNALQMVRQCSWHLISKLRCDAALYFPYEGEQKQRGAKKKYGDKLNYRHYHDLSLVFEAPERREPMLGYSTLVRKERDFLSMTGVTVEEFDEVVPAFQASFERHLAEWNMDGTPRVGRVYRQSKTCPVPATEDKFLLVLVFLGKATDQTLHGQLFGLSQSNTNKWRQRLLAVLDQTLAQLGERPARRAAEVARRLRAEPAGAAPAAAADQGADQRVAAPRVFFTTAPTARSDAPATRRVRKTSIAARRSTTA